MGVYRRGGVWWVEFRYAGKRIRESAKTTRKTLALEYEKRRRRELEEGLVGAPLEDRRKRMRTVAEAADEYERDYPLNHRPKSVQWVKERLKPVRRHLGSRLAASLTEDAMRGYVRHRLAETVSGRTINMELDILARAIGSSRRDLWPGLRRQEERSDVGRALSGEEEIKLLQAADQAASPTIGTFLRVALLTAMRSGEIAGLTWGRVDFGRGAITVGQAKTDAGTGRTIPMSRNLRALLEAHAAWSAKTFGECRPEWYLFPFGQFGRQDPRRPTRSIKRAWERVRKAAGVHCRLHDLRHTAITKMAECGVPEITMKAIAGHVSSRMLERYSHARMQAKLEAVETLTLAPQREEDASSADRLH